MAAGDPKQKPKSARKPLHPINSPITTTTAATPKKSKPEWTDQNKVADLNKENKDNQQIQVVKIETFDASLADELTAIRKKMERLRLDKDITEKMLEQRAAAMDDQLKEIHQRGEIQKLLELEVDRLYRLNQLKSYCQRISSIRTLREKEEEKRMGGSSPCQYHHEEGEEESVGENSLNQSPCSSEHVVTEKEE